MFSLNKVLNELPEEKKNEIVDKNVEGGFFFLFSKFFRFGRSFGSSKSSSKSSSKGGSKSSSKSKKGGYSRW